MKDQGRAGVMLAAALSALAGYVDAVGFMTLGGFFVSFMSGNSTRLGVGLATGAWSQAATAAALIALFVLGVVIGGSVARRVGEGRRAVILAVEAAFLILGALACTLGWRAGGMTLVVMAMGIENAVLQRQGDVGVGLTYMTGTLVRIGQRIATALHGGPRWDWFPYLCLWAGLTTGGALGAMTFLKLDVAALWPAVAALLGLTLATGLAERRAARR